MDTGEYTILDIKYSDEDQKKVEEFNNEHTRKALTLLTHVRDMLTKSDEFLDESIPDRVKRMQEHPDFKQFCMEYPIVSKYIIAYGLFSARAFKKYLDWKAKCRPSDSMRAKLAGDKRAQEKFKNRYIYGIYVKFLYQEVGSYKSIKEVHQMYEETVADLNKEIDEFFDLFDKAKEEAANSEKEDEEYRKKILLEQVKELIKKENQ